MSYVDMTLYDVNKYYFYFFNLQTKEITLLSHLSLSLAIASSHIYKFVRNTWKSNPSYIS